MYPTLSIRQLPIFRIGVMIISGISLLRITDSYLSLLETGLAMCLLLVVINLVPFIKNYYFKSASIHFVGLLSGMIIMSVQHCQTQENIKSIRNYKNKIHRIYEIQEIKSSDKYTTLYTQLTGVYDRLYRSTKNIGVVIRIKNELALSHQLSLGTSIISSNQPTIITSNPTPTGFDYSKYLSDKGYHFHFFANAKEYEILTFSNYSFWKSIRYKYRNKAIQIFDMYLSSQSNAILKALVLGDRSDINAATNTKFANSGIIHILAVSGLHVGIIALLLFQFIERALFFTRPNAWTKTIFIIVGLIAFAEISGGAPPVWRAVIMSSIYLISKSISRKTHPLNLLGLAGMLILSLNPTDLFSVSFQLSFLAVGGIVTFTPWLLYIYQPQRWLLKKAWAIIALGISAQIGTLPLTLFYFHQLPLLSPIAGLIAIPLATLLLCTGMSLLLVGWWSNYLATIIADIVDLLISILQSFAQVLSTSPKSLWSNIWIEEFHVLLILTSLVCCSLWLYDRRRIYFKICIASMITCLITYAIQYEFNYAKPYKVVYRESPLTMDIMIHGTCYHINLNYNHFVSDYMTSDIRSKHRVTNIININSSSLKHPVIQE